MEVFNLIFGIIIGLISLTFLVALHELGHALAAKKNGVKLKEYAIGFPPRIRSFKAKTDKRKENFAEKVEENKEKASNLLNKFLKKDKVEQEEL